MAQAGKLGEVVETLAPRFLHRHHAQDPALRGLVRAMASDTGADAFVLQQRAIMSRPDSRPLLADIRCPTVVIVGDGDDLTPPDLASEICGEIPGARLVVVPNCGHLSTIEQPDAVNAALAVWLDA
jgi:pimeloyl-ACP methyl ester carboxylesterase